MTEAYTAVELAIADVERLRRYLAKRTPAYCRADELDLISANIKTWLHPRRGMICTRLGTEAVSDPDSRYNALLAATTRRTLRRRYCQLLKNLKISLALLLQQHAVELAASPQTAADASQPPSFQRLAADVRMQQLLRERWLECASCAANDLPLAAVVMMGGMLEALLLARINRLNDKSAVFTANCAPRDKAGKTHSLSRWMLSDYLDVAHELGWLTDTYRDIGAVLRDYRNYIHPYKQYQQGMRIGPDDAKALWGIANTIAKQILTF